jgi:hypothetical protein
MQPLTKLCWMFYPAIVRLKFFFVSKPRCGFIEPAGNQGFHSGAI